jgi:hypothetical protein
MSQEISSRVEPVVAMEENKNCKEWFEGRKSQDAISG